jgi:predicted DNA-binding transcriptional regulator AlpA
VRDQLHTTKEASEFLRMSEAWLRRCRRYGGGPRFVKFARAVRYKESDLVEWVEQHAGYRSASDAA